MVNIPDAIKALFKADGTWKNFRVHFPNGEYPDITNDNVVRESLHFTESLCSQDPFKFGLAEASVIEFETVGIGNMYGMTIEAGIEIDTSSLSAADITAIDSDPGDGVLVLAADSDLGFGFYRVPLGTFKVTSCPRDHQNMAHRKVTAYTDFTGGKLQNSAYELGKLKRGWLSGDYTPNLLRMVTAARAYYDPSIVAGHTVLSSAVLTEYNNSQNFQKTVGPGVIQGQIWWTNSYSAADMIDHICVLDLAGYDIDSAGAWVKAQYEARGLGEYADAAAEYVRARIAPRVGSLITVIDSAEWSGGYTYISPTDNKIVAYPHTVSDALTGVLYAGIMTRVSLTVRFGAQTVSNNFTGLDLSNTRCRVLDDSFADIRGRFAPTGKYGARLTFVDAYDFDSIFVGLLEMNGKFGKVSRAGEIAEFTIDGSSPVSVDAGDYAECWWDEYDVSPVGTVTVTFKESGGETTADITIGDGASVYDMTDNEALKSIDGMTLSDLETFFAGDFATNAANVGFTPAELTMQGWPWIEAGDALEITAEDGTVIDTYALRVDLSGIQRLSMDIESKGGEIIGEV